ncbi:MAG: glycosyltransferase [Desulfobacteraceae bacterium]|nr:MAG: glycosyltransferase [Desulfobacteraceae bacterium]
MKQKRILVFCPWAYSTSYYTAQFCNAVASDQNKVFLVAPKNFMTDLLSKNVERINWPYIAPFRTNLSSVFQTPCQVISFIRILNKILPDWIQLLWKHPLPVILKPYLKKYKIGFTVHDPVLHLGEGGIFRSWIHKKLIEMADILFVHGEKNRENLIRNFEVDTQKIYKIPYGNVIAWNHVADVAQEDSILFFGRLKKYKGMEILLEAFKKAEPRIPGYRLVIRGQGDPDDVPAIIKFMPNVDFENRFVPHNEIPELFARAGFVVLPYLDGTQSGVVAMAFAFGRTCIASAVGAIPEIVKNGENGLLVAPGNADDLAEKIIQLATDHQSRGTLEKGAIKTSESIASDYREGLLKIVIKAYF